MLYFLGYKDTTKKRMNVHYFIKIKTAFQFLFLQIRYKATFVGHRPPIRFQKYIIK